MRGQMHLCACVSEERGDGEVAGSQALSLLSDTQIYINLATIDIRLFAKRGPMHLCACESEEKKSSSASNKNKKLSITKTVRVRASFSLVPKKRLLTLGV